MTNDVNIVTGSSTTSSQNILAGSQASSLSSKPTEGF